ncbi:uncharacterized protein MONOS_17400 [Monocercomonoides exilis]|uniref:uncharacterized protein n=1 Tax=Monocercomonoides exilis TaxID=2049356 RepID=UPI0035594650|nr:hypothetical protein MONOS_17400 [Monocercomonoides exilis]
MLKTLELRAVRMLVCKRMERHVGLMRLKQEVRGMLKCGIDGFRSTCGAGADEGGVAMEKELGGGEVGTKGGLDAGEIGMEIELDGGKEGVEGGLDRGSDGGHVDGNSENNIY